MLPLVSVVIVNHNYGRYLGECIDSVLAQTYSRIETIVVDDGSTDNSLEVLRSYSNRLTVLARTIKGPRRLAMPALREAPVSGLRFWTPTTYGCQRRFENNQNTFTTS